MVVAELVGFHVIVVFVTYFYAELVVELNLDWNHGLADVIEGLVSVKHI